MCYILYRIYTNTIYYLLFTICYTCIFIYDSYLYCSSGQRAVVRRRSLSATATRPLLIMSMCMCVDVCACACMCVHVCACVCMRVCVCVCTRAYACNTHARERGRERERERESFIRNNVHNGAYVSKHRVEYPLCTVLCIHCTNLNPKPSTVTSHTPPPTRRIPLTGQTLCQP